MANYRLAQIFVVLAVVKLGVGYGEYGAAGTGAKSSNQNEGASYKTYEDESQSQENDADNYGDAGDAQSAYSSMADGKSDYGDSAEAAKDELDMAESSEDFAQALNQNTMLGGNAEELGSNAYGSQGHGYGDEDTTENDYDQNQPDTSQEDEATSQKEEHKCPLRRNKWVPFQSFWFKALPLKTGRSDTYEEAMEKCKKIGGRLMSIHNKETKVFIADQLEKCDINKAITSARFNKGKLEWADEAEDSTVAKGAAKKVTKTNHCLFLKARKASGTGKYWRGLNCNTDISDVVCMKDYDECATKATIDALCPKGFTCPNVESTKCPDRCSNVWGGYKCECEKGYERVTEYALKCTDINECTTNKHTCSDGCPCENTEGSYECKDKNECDLNTHNCPSGHACENTHCSFKCNDVDECTLNQPCETDCTCTNTVGGYTCQQPNGCDNHQCTSLQTCVPNGCTHTCVGKNECQLDEHDCETGCACTDTDTGKGFTCEPANGCDNHQCTALQTCVQNGCTHTCEGKNECQLNEHDCETGCACTDTDTGKGFTCQPANGCDNHQCTSLQTCVQNGCTHTCEGKNECQLDLDDCGNGCACFDTDTGRGFTCDEKDDCDPNPCGTRRQCVKDGCTHSCVDINECDLGTHNCGACDCTNTEGSWECENEDPCNDGTSTCTGNQNCVRTDACRGYKCEAVSQCDAGYEGELCCDVNECENDPCPADEYCTNTDGSHTCSKCAEGYKIAANKECVLKSEVIRQTSRQYDDPEGSTNKAGLANDGDISRTDSKCTIVVPNAFHYSWWYVELGGTFPVYGAAIYTRQGDLRLKDFAICTESYIPSSSSDKRTMNTSPCTSQCYRMTKESTVAELYECTSVKNGNNVRIQDHWKGGKLPLCEVEVYTKPLPIAYFKSAKMHGVDDSVADLAVDGKNYGPEFWGLGGETCALSAQAATPYFFVDLGKNVDVAGVFITNDPNNWCKKEGYHHAGDDLKYYSGKTYEECRAKCESKAACFGSTTNHGTKGCWLHKIIHDNKVQKKTNHALFIKNCKNKIASKIKNYDVFVKKDKPEFKKPKCGTTEPRNIDELCAFVKERLAGPKKIACDKVINGRYVGIVVRRVPNVDFKIELCTFHVIVGNRAPNDYKTTHRTCKPCDDGTTCGAKTCCTCNDGYDGEDCTNVDECAAGWSKCPSGSSCVDKKDGTYKCEGTTCSSCAEDHECANDGTNDCILKCTEDPPVALGLIYGYNMNYDYYYELHQNVKTSADCGKICGNDYRCKAASYLIQNKVCYLQNRLLAIKIYFSSAYQIFVKCPKVGEAHVDAVFWVSLHREKDNKVDGDDLGWAYCYYDWAYCEETFCPYICRARSDCMGATFASNRYCYFHTVTTQKRIKHYNWHSHYLKRCKEP